MAKGGDKRVAWRQYAAAALTGTYSESSSLDAATDYAVTCADEMLARESARFDGEVTPEPEPEPGPGPGQQPA